MELKVSHFFKKLPQQVIFSKYFKSRQIFARLLYLKLPPLVLKIALSGHTGRASDIPLSCKKIVRLVPVAVCTASRLISIE